MAHFLIVTQPVDGHVNPLVPISRALIEQGSQVTWITGRLFKKKVEGTGAVFIPYPEAFDPGEKPVYEFWPEMAKLKSISQNKWVFKHLFMDSSLPLYQSIKTVIKRHPADILVADPVTFGAFWSAEIAGITSVMISLLPLFLPSKDTPPAGLGLTPGTSVLTKLRNRCLNYIVPNIFFADVINHGNKIRNKMGLPSFGRRFSMANYSLPSLIVQLSTPAFEYPRSDQPTHLHFVGPVLPEDSQDFSPPPWWSDIDGDRPVILINQGTVAKNLDDVIKPAIDALKNEDILMVAVPVTKDALPSAPENLRIESFIPFDVLLPYVDVMITNGGYGGTQFALAHGIPLVVAGATEDKMEVAARVEWSGSGINLRQKRPSPSSIKKAVSEVLSNPIYRENAKRIQADLNKYNAPDRTAELLEQLADNKGIPSTKRRKKPPNI